MGELKCKCGEKMPNFQKLCYSCKDAKTIADAEKVEPSTPLNIVGSDNYFDCLEEAGEQFANQWAHPCTKDPLRVDPKRCAESLVETTMEWMTEEAFEDAWDYVNGQAELTAAIEAALVAFNEAQTAYSWTPETKKVFQIPEVPA